MITKDHGRISHKFNEAAHQAFELLSHSIGVRTFFVGKTTDVTFSVVKLFNKNGCIVEEGVSVPIEESYCNMIYRNGHEPVIIEDSSSHPIVSGLGITEAANIGSYLGVPIILEDNSMFGTLCAIDPSPYRFEVSDLELMQTLANFIGNAIDLGKAYERIVIEEHRVQEELMIARKVQTSVLPEPIQSENFHINAYYQSSESLSGDMYSWFQLAPNQYGVIILDVMGHGVSSSLISMSIHSVLRGIITTITEPIEVMKELSRHIYRLFNSNMHSTYATAIYMVIDTLERTIEYVNAGHPYGLLLAGDSQVKLLDEGCLPLGIFPEVNVKKGKISYQESTTVLLYTDGLVDLINFSIQDGIDTLAANVLNQPNSQALTEEIQAKYVDGKTLTDDVCFIAFSAK